MVRNSLALLTRAGHLEFVEEITTQSRVMVIMNKRELYDLKLDSVTDSVFQLILRTYTGLFADYVYISEDLIASRLRLTGAQVYDALLALQRQHAIHYVPRKTTPYILMTSSRQLPKHLTFPPAIYEQMQQRMKHRVDTMRRFVFDDNKCRVNTMLEYFGETPTAECGTCDVCRERRKQSVVSEKQLTETIMYLLSHGNRPTIDYIARQASVSPDRVIKILRPLLDEGVIQVSSDGEVSLTR